MGEQVNDSPGSIVAVVRGLASRRGLSLLALTLLAGVVGSHLLQERVTKHLIARVVSAQTMKVRENVHRFDETLAQAERSIRRYAALVSYRQADLNGMSSDLESIARLDRDGAWRTPMERLKAGTDAGVWIPPDVPLSLETRQFFVRTQEITRLFGLGAEDALLTNTWALPLTNGEVVFWPSRPDFVKGAAANLDYRTTPWVQLTNPRLNADGAPRWTDPDYDPAAREWLISVVAPFQRDGKWAGSVGLIDGVVSLRLGERLRGGLLEGVAVQLAPLSELLDQACWADLPEHARPSGTPRQEPAPLLRASTGHAPLTAEEEQELEESNLPELIERLWQSTSLPEQAEVLEQLVQRLGLDAVLQGPGGSATPKQLLEEIYRRALADGDWNVVRRSAGSLDLVHPQLEDALTDLLVRQKQVVVGRNYTNDSLISEPTGSRRIAAMIRRFCGEDGREWMLHQELLLALDGLARLEPDLLSGSLTLQLGQLLLLRGHGGTQQRDLVGYLGPDLVPRLRLDGGGLEHRPSMRVDEPAAWSAGLRSRHAAREQSRHHHRHRPRPRPGREHLRY